MVGAMLAAAMTALDGDGETVVLVGAGPASQFVPSWGVYSLTYIFDDADTHWSFLASHYDAEMLKALRPGAYDACGVHVRVYIPPRIGEVPLQGLTASTVKALYAELHVRSRSRGRPAVGQDGPQRPPPCHGP
jgi:hypothetical protein